ncbi:glycosyltransferase family 61 protein [Prosthecobacter sp.]|uniref:glycosyltransferase family 61 protein n=1 Tax=Prosthecobacter sp. TaxID=1965333 RepID=UPI003784928A
MKSHARSILDAYNRLLRLCGRRLRVSEADKAVGLQERRTVVSGGSRSDTNPLEIKVNGPETATFDFDWPTAELFRLRDVWLTGDQGQVFLEDGSLFEPWVRPYNLAKLKISQPLKLGATQIKGPVFHLTGRNHENRGHFMLQHLPRLMAARDYLKSLPDYRILVAPGHSRWQGRYIAWAGLDPSKLVEGTRGTMQVDDLIFIPNLYGKSSLCPPPFYNELSDCAASYPVPDGPGRPLFITRRDAPDKQLMNEERIVEILRSKIGPVDLIRLGEHPLPDQIGMFRAAPLVMGAIGQGICNVLFCKTTLLVMLAPGTPDKQVYTTSHGAQLARICGNEALTFLSNEPAPSRGDWTFPEERFITLLDRLLQQPEAARIKPAAT